MSVAIIQPGHGQSHTATIGEKDVATSLLLKKQEGVKIKISLDCAVADFLRPKQIVISLKGGELYCVCVVIVSGSLHQPLTSNYLFLANRLSCSR